MTKYRITLAVDRDEFYEVEAADIDAARAAFDQGEGTFIDYEARNVEIDSIEEVTE